MKIKITYNNEKELKKLLNIPLSVFIDKGARVKKTDKNAPFLHCYIDFECVSIDKIL